MKHFVNNRGIYSENSPDNSSTLTVSGNIYVSGTINAETINASITATEECFLVDLAGSDTTGDGSISKPFRTIGYAISQVPTSGPITPWLIKLGIGTFFEDGLVLPDYVSLLGFGDYSSRITSIHTGSTIITLGGLRNKVENISISAPSTGSSVIGVASTVTSSFYRQIPRFYNSIIRNCYKGVQCHSGSSLLCDDIRTFDSTVGFCGEETLVFDLYGCHAYQLDNPRAVGTIGYKYTGFSPTENIMTFNDIESEENEIAIQVNGLSNATGGAVVGLNAFLKYEGTGIQINHSSQIEIQNLWSQDVIDFEIEQTRATASAKFRNASINFEKFSLIAGGESNIAIMGMDENFPDTLRVRGDHPTYQMRDLMVDVVSGGLWRTTCVGGEWRIEKNTHVSGTFSTFDVPFYISSNGNISIGQAIPNGHEFEVLGSVALVESGALYFYSGTSCCPEPHYIAFRRPENIVSNSFYTWPMEMPPSESLYLMGQSDGTLLWSSSLGEPNSGSNLGTGEEVYAGKNGIALEFKSLVAGTNISLSSDANEITIANIGAGEANSGSNLGTDWGLYAGKTGIALDFKSLVPGTNIEFTSSSNDITVSTTAEINSGSNLGAGTGIYSGKTGVALEFKSLVAGTNITLTPAADSITIDSGDPGASISGSNIGSGIGVYSGKVGSALEFKSLVAGPNITIVSSSTTLEISGSSLGEANSGSNLGTGFGIYADKVGVALEFKSLIPSGNVYFVSDSNSITIGHNEGTASNIGTGLGVFNSIYDTTLLFNNILTQTSSLNSILTSSLIGNDIVIAKRSKAKIFQLEDDFTGNTGFGVYEWNATTNGVGSLVGASTVGVDSLVERCMGVCELRTGTNAAGRAAIGSYANVVRLDALESTFIEWRVNLQALSVVAQEYIVDFGWMDNFGAGDQVNGVYFEYDRLSAGDLWLSCTSNTSSRTKTSTGIVPQSATYDTFRIETNSGLTQALFYINNVLVGTNTLNLPTGVGKMMGFGAKIRKSAGATARSIYIDYCNILCNWPSGERT